jgi:hypothetical protein
MNQEDYEILNSGQIKSEIEKIKQLKKLTTSQVSDLIRLLEELDKKNNLEESEISDNEGYVDLKSKITT